MQESCIEHYIESFPFSPAETSSEQGLSHPFTYLTLQGSPSTEKNTHLQWEREWHPTLALTATKVLPTKWNAGWLECCFPPPCRDSKKYPRVRQRAKLQKGSWMLLGFVASLNIRFSRRRRLPVGLNLLLHMDAHGDS